MKITDLYQELTEISAKYKEKSHITIAQKEFMDGFLDTVQNAVADLSPTQNLLYAATTGLHEHIDLNILHLDKPFMKKYLVEAKKAVLGYIEKKQNTLKRYSNNVEDAIAGVESMDYKLEKRIEKELRQEVHSLSMSNKAKDKAEIRALEQKAEIKERLQGSIKRRDKKVNKLKQGILGLEEQVDSYKSEVEVKIKEVRELEVTVKKVTEQKGSVQSSAEKASAQVKSLQQRVKELEKSYTALERKYSSEKTRYEAKVQKETVQKEKYKAQVTKQKEEVRKQKAEVKKQKAAVRSKNAEVRKAKKQAKDKAAEARQKQTEIKSLEKENTSLEKTLERTEKKYTASEKKKEEQTKKIRHYSGKASYLEREYKKLEAKYFALENKYAEDITKVKEEFKDLEKTLEERKKDVETIKELEKDNAYLQKEIEKIESLKDQFENAEKKYAELEKRYNTGDSQKSKDLEKEIAVLKNQNAEHERQHEADAKLLEETYENHEKDLEELAKKQSAAPEKPVEPEPRTPANPERPAEPETPAGPAEPKRPEYSGPEEPDFPPKNREDKQTDPEEPDYPGKIKDKKGGIEGKVDDKQKQGANIINIDALRDLHALVYVLSENGTDAEQRKAYETFLKYVEDPIVKAEVLNNLACIYSDVDNNPGKAKLYFADAVKESEKAAELELNISPERLAVYRRNLKSCELEERFIGRPAYVLKDSEKQGIVRRIVNKMPFVGKKAV